MSDFNMPEPITVTVNKFANDLKIDILYAGRGSITLVNANAERPGLQLAGFFGGYEPQNVMVVGLSEYEYLRSFSSEERATRVERLFDYGEIPCIIVTRDLPTLPEFMSTARKYACPIFRTGQLATAVVNELSIYLNDLLAPTTSKHGVLMDVFGVGILITGHSGVGKSETAMELIKRGHRLCADDSVLIKRRGKVLFGTSPETIRYFMELRGIGIINIKSMYGSGSVIGEKEVELVIELENWNAESKYDRIGGNNYTEDILGIAVPKLIIPVTPGRNLAIIIEVAARNFRLKEMGYDAAQELMSRTIGR